MGSVRRWAILPVLALLIAAVAAVTMPRASADTAPGPGKLNNACALKNNGLLRYVAIPAVCDYKGKGAARRRHQPPVLAGIEAAAFRYTAGTPPVPVTARLTVRSPASTTLVGATARVSSGFTAGRDLLRFTSRSGITGGFKASSGVLTLKGSASSAAYQAALRSVTYRDSDAEAPTGTRTISFQVSDGEPDHSLSNVATRIVLVTRVKPPGAVNDTATTGKNSAININVLANDTNPAGRPLTVTSVNITGTKGMVSVNHEETIRYNPNGHFAGLSQGQTATDTFTYKATDGHQTSKPATVTVTITGSNDAPVISKIETTPLSYQASNLSAVAVTSTLTVSDDAATMSGATVSITSGFEAANDYLSFPGQHVGITGSYNFATAVLTLTGTASTADYQAALRSVAFFTYGDGPSMRTVSFTVKDSLGATSTPAARTIDVTAPIGFPAVVNQSYTIVGNTPLDVGTTPSGPAVTVGGSLLTGDSDSDPAATLYVSTVTTPAHGTLSLGQNGTFTYVPNPGYSGTDGFQATITAYASGAGVMPSSTENVTITVGTVVWYVNDSKAAAGNGEAATPFNTLAAANAAARANSIIFLYQGDATYAGGVTMQPGEDLWGQPHGLTVGGYHLIPAGGSPPVITSGKDGIDLAEGADVEGVDVHDPGYIGIAGTNVNDATIGVTTPVSIMATAGPAISIKGGAGALDFGDTSVINPGLGNVTVTGRSGGTVTFGGPVTASGVSLINNAGAAIAFTGTLTLSGGRYGGGFAAAGGGTVTATGTGSTLASEIVGDALSVENTAIGGAGLTFQRISSSGLLSSFGIELDNTGSAGSLTVTGTGTPGSGGTIQNSGAQGAAIQLTSTYAPSLTDMVIQNNAGDGISGTQVNSLTLNGCTVAGNGNDGLLINADGTTNATVSVTGSTFTNNVGDAFQFSTDPASTGTDRVTFSNNTLNSTVAGITGGGVDITPAGNSHTAITVDGNNIQNPVGVGIEIDENGGASGMLTGAVSGNTIGAPTAAGSGGGAGIGVSAEGSGTETLAITGNSLYQYSNQAGINFIDREGNPVMDLTITGNTIADPGGHGGWGIHGEDGAQTTDNGTVCAAITGNSIARSGQVGQGGADIELNQNDATTIKLPGYTGSAGNTNAVRSFLQGNNISTPPPTALATVSVGGGGFTGGPSC